MAPPPKTGGPLVQEWPGGLTWLADPSEYMQRASHALATSDGVWLVDPLDTPAVHAAIEELGDVAGVVVLLDRHTRDAAAFAERYGVPVSVPTTVSIGPAALDAAVEPFDGELGETGYRARPAIDLPFWRAAMLVSEDGGTVVVGDVLGTAAYFRAPAERLAVHPALRLWPPRRRFRGLDPDRLLVGHGEPVLEGAGDAIRDALAGARRRAPWAYWRALMTLVRR